MRKEVRKALEVGKLLRSLGYPTEKDAEHIGRDANTLNVPCTVDDVRRFYDIYGAQVAAIRERTTKKNLDNQQLRTTK
jgi:hypothetical protein